MNEHDRAEALAAWLDQGGPPPDGLDPEVVEAVYILSPERAGPPAVDPDAILGSIRSGPLAIPTPAASFVPANRPWPFAVGLSAVALAAVALLVARFTLPSSYRGAGPLEELPAVEEAHPARAPAPSSPTIPELPTAHRDTTASHPPLQEMVVAGERDLEAGEAVDDAVVSAEEVEPFADGAEPSVPPAKRAAPLPMEADRAGSIEEDAVAMAEEEVQDAPVARTGPLDGPGASNDAIVPAESRTPKLKRARRAAKARTGALGAASPAPPAAARAEAPGAPASSPAPQHPELQAARDALLRGDPPSAVDICERWLRQHPGDTPLRAAFYTVLGDAHTALGHPRRARAAYAEATRIRQAR